MAAIQVFAIIGMAVSGLVAAKAAYEAACWARGIVLDARRYRDLRRARLDAHLHGGDPREAIWDAFASH